MPDAAYWAVAKTNTQRETFAAQRLTERGFEVFLPRIAAGRGITPLFRSYLFCRIGADGHWRAIETTMGVFKVIRFGDTPARCPEAEVEALMDKVDPDGVIRLPDKPSSPARHLFEKGDAVRIVGGPLQGVSALHSGMSAAQKEILLISMLGSARQVAVPAHLVEVA